MYTTTQTSSPRSPHELAFRRSRNPNIHSKYSGGTKQYSVVPNSPGSQFKVSEILNPDGSVSIRNILIAEDGSWSKEEQEINSQRREMLLRRENLSSARVANFDRHDRLKNETEIDPSEGLAHQLRRQRLARSSLFPDGPSDSTKGRRSPNRAQRDASRNNGANSPSNLSPGPFRRSKMMNTTEYSPKYSPPTHSPTNASTPSSILRQAGSKKSKSRHKHVVYSEPLTSERLRPSKEVLDNANHDYYFHTVRNDPIVDIYSDLDSRERQAVNQSFSSGDSSVFDDVPQTSNIDEALGQLNTYVGDRAFPKSYADDDKEQRIPHLYSVTVYKHSKADKIGIYVHRESLSDGRHRLVISEVAPDGKFANTRVKKGDIVISINGQDMIEEPTLDRALRIVSSATKNITIVAHESLDGNDSQSEVNDSNSESAAQTTISSISKDQSSFTYSEGYPPKYEENLNLFRSVEGPDSFARESDKKRFGAKAAAKRGAMTMDGSMLLTKSLEISEPIPIKTNESWKVSGVIVVNIEKNASVIGDPGLHIGTKKTSSGLILYVADISPSSVFKRTSLRIGDIIISINSVSFFDHPDIFDAYSALGKPGKRITLVAKRGEKSLNDFLLDRKGQADLPQTKSPGRKSISTALTAQTSGAMASVSEESAQYLKNDGTRSHNSTLSGNRSNAESTKHGETRTLSGKDNESLESADAKKGNEINLDEMSNPSCHITITKNTHDDPIGLDVAKVATGWGMLLAISKIVPGSKASLTELKVGDVILTVNGTSFRNNPDLLSVISLVREAQRQVCIEFQKLSSFSQAIQLDLQKSLSMLEMAEQSQKSTSMNRSVENQGGEQEYKMTSNSLLLHDEGGESKQKGSTKRQKVLVTVTKDHPGQKIGLDFALLDDKLVVTDVSPKGLLRNAPLVYGDTILSINGVSFQQEPIPKEAYDLIKQARKKVTIEILKVQYAHNNAISGANNGVSTKSCIPATLICGRRKKIDHRSARL